MRSGDGRGRLARVKRHAAAMKQAKQALYVRRTQTSLCDHTEECKQARQQRAHVRSGQPRLARDDAHLVGRAACNEALDHGEHTIAEQGGIAVTIHAGSAACREGWM